MVFELWPPNALSEFFLEGLTFREWQLQDAPRMCYLFNTEQMNRWTPLPSPFTLEEAVGYVERADDLRRRLGSLQLAVCVTRLGVVGELLLFPGQDPADLELAYGVGVEYQGKGYAQAAVRAGLSLARDAGMSTATLMIAVDNLPSIAVAARTGFRRTQRPLEHRRRKGFVLQLATWERELI